MSGGLPATRHEMERAYYKFLNHGACTRCRKPVEWWQTTRGKKLPFDPPQTADPLHELAEVHPSDCMAALQAVPPRGPAERQRAVEGLAHQYGARLVLVLDEGGYTYAAKHGLDPEDLRHELITAANEIRREIGAKR